MSLNIHMDIQMLREMTHFLEHAAMFVASLLPQSDEMLTVKQPSQVKKFISGGKSLEIA